MDMYYSLVVRADESLPVPIDRMFEYTDSEVISQFRCYGKPDLTRLSEYPVILTKEFRDEDSSVEAVIGYMNEPSLNPRVSNPVLKFPAKTLVERGLITGRWGGSHTMWMVSKGDPYRLLAGVGITANGSIAEEVITNERQIAVMMPFENDASIDPVYRALREGAKDAGFECVRVDQLMTPTDITDDIRKLIVESRAIIADLTGKNLNVMYELGFAHGHDKRAVLISSDSLDGLPFDIRPQRVLPYQKSEIGLIDLKSKVASALRSIK